MTEDEQEARSIAYACQCRVAVLASGRWAIWFGPEPAPVIVDNFEPEQMKKLILGAQELREQQRESAATPLSIEELGL